MGEPGALDLQKKKLQKTLLRDRILKNVARGLSDEGFRPILQSCVASTDNCSICGHRTV